MNLIPRLKKPFYLHFEWLALSIALVAMAMLNPESTANSICPLDLLGFENCPGDGLGKSMAFSFRGKISESFQAHPAGLPAILIIMTRIGSIFKRNLQFSKTEEMSNEDI
ncbi:MAG: DUF2752 domain-containing protein [Balneolaceae bacterium]|nr:MAG: DUF2752 domain-containing protein [Balneolaceae bacterium]